MGEKTAKKAFSSEVETQASALCFLSYLLGDFCWCPLLRDAMVRIRLKGKRSQLTFEECMAAF